MVPSPMRVPYHPSRKTLNLYTKGSAVFNQFTNLYPVIKTLRFELKPIGNTMDTIESNQVIHNDEKRADAYAKLKVTLDAYHKDIIEKVLSRARLTGLEDYAIAVNNLKTSKGNAAYGKELTKNKEQLRKQIAGFFKQPEFAPIFKDLFKEGVIKKDVKAWIDTQPNPTDYFYSDDFANFTGYFGNYNLIRQNLYNPEAKHGTIAYRLIDENLPKFIDNLSILQNIQNKNPDLFDQLSDQYQQYFSELLPSKPTLADFVSLDTFNDLLTQKGLDAYQQIIGGIKTENQLIQGINVLINLHNQQHPEQSKTPKLKPLYKQLLSDRGTFKLPRKFEDDAEMIQANRQYFEEVLGNNTLFETGETPAEAMNQLFLSIENYDLSKIFIESPLLVTSISQKIYGSYAVIPQALEYYHDNHVNPSYAAKFNKAKSDKSRETMEKAKVAWVKGIHAVSVIHQALIAYNDVLPDDAKLTDTQPVISYYKDIQYSEKTGESQQIFDALMRRYHQAKGMLNTDYPKGSKQILNNKSSFAIVKNLLDVSKAYVNAARDLTIKKPEGLDLDLLFYERLAKTYTYLQDLHALYDTTRNYVTQKPFSTDKIKLNFDCAQLLAGWDFNVIDAKRGVFLVKNGRYYLVIIDNKHKKAMNNLPAPITNNCYDKYNMRLSKDAHMALPKKLFTKDNLKIPAIAEMERRCRDKNGGHHLRKSPDFDKDFMHQMIDTFKDIIKKDKDFDVFGFQFKPTHQYEDINEFYADFNEQALVTWYDKVDSDVIDSLVAEGKIYLFEVYSKDFSDKSTGTPNQQSLILQYLFSQDNLAKHHFKLNGEAEVFYRKASIDKDKAVVHKKGSLLENKNPARPNSKIAKFDIVKDRHYTENKLFLHIPITLNNNAADMKSYAMNSKVLNTLKTNGGVNVIGIDRGERNLLNITVINSAGEILHQESLNKITSGQDMVTDYHELLDKKEQSRAESRLNWQEVESIKEIKQGYLSQVVYRLSQLMLQYKAIVALEDLNIGFKRGRFKIEKQVYQNFEKALINKLNYLVLKQLEATEVGGTAHGYQLTAPFESFQKLGKQSGWLFYVPAWNTSHIDPTTGFVNLHHFKYESVAQATDIIDKLSNIRYNPEKDYFEFAIDYNEFTFKGGDSQKYWVVCSTSYKRYVFDKKANMGRGGTKAIDINAELKVLFAAHGVDYASGEDLRPQIKAKANKELLSQLLFLLKTLTAMRYTNASSYEDYILSPVANKAGEFFDSRKGDAALPLDADSNGSYHIALKGLCLLQRVYDWRGEEFKGLDLFISNNDWLKFAQDRH